MQRLISLRNVHLYAKLCMVCVCLGGVKIVLVSPWIGVLQGVCSLFMEVVAFRCSVFVDCVSSIGVLCQVAGVASSPLRVYVCLVE